MAGIGSFGQGFVSGLDTTSTQPQLPMAFLQSLTPQQLALFSQSGTGTGTNPFMSTPNIYIPQQSQGGGNLLNSLGKFAQSPILSPNGAIGGAIDRFGSNFLGIGTPTGGFVGPMPSNFVGPMPAGGVSGGITSAFNPANLAGGFAGNFLGNSIFGDDRGMGSSIGGTLGGIAGQALIPIPGVGAAIGSFLGNGLGGLLGGGEPPMNHSNFLMEVRNTKLADGTKTIDTDRKVNYGTKSIDESKAKEVQADFGSYLKGINALVPDANMNNLVFDGGFNDKYEGGYYIRGRTRKLTKDPVTGKTVHDSSVPEVVEKARHFKMEDANSKLQAYQEVVLESLQKQGRLTPDIEAKIRGYSPQGGGPSQGQGGSFSSTGISAPLVAPNNSKPKFDEYVAAYRAKQKAGEAK